MQNKFTWNKAIAQLSQSRKKTPYLGGIAKKLTLHLRWGIIQPLDKTPYLRGIDMQNKSLGLVKCRIPRAFCQSTFRKTTSQLKGDITDSHGKAHSTPEPLRQCDIMRRPDSAYYNPRPSHMQPYATYTKLARHNARPCAGYYNKAQPSLQRPITPPPPPPSL